MIFSQNFHQAIRFHQTTAANEKILTKNGEGATPTFQNCDRPKSIFRTKLAKVDISMVKIFVLGTFKALKQLYPKTINECNKNKKNLLPLIFLQN